MADMGERVLHGVADVQGVGERGLVGGSLVHPRARPSTAAIAPSASTSSRTCSASGTRSLHSTRSTGALAAPRQLPVISSSNRTSPAVCTSSSRDPAGDAVRTSSSGGTRTSSSVTWSLSAPARKPLAQKALTLGDRWGRHRPPYETPLTWAASRSTLPMGILVKR
ncbi:hypothetical protein G3I71_09370 [Streptomyces sp. SID12501]|uniref:Uncharacterized protein n=1 Tax=Streptomyces sp. SID12501 TaxID=2706042 RepID=A0A6B3BNW7_9ACTN|nr:hypothetical protein [Streptomyces sp. SID12501]